MAAVPTRTKKIQVVELSSDFRRATKVVEADLEELKDNEVLVKIAFVGINASDINFTAGKYTRVAVPFDAGFEAAGTVIAIGSAVKSLKVGDSVAATSYGSFAEYKKYHEKVVHRVPFLAREVLPLMVSGLTASLALSEVGQMQAKDTVLVTAAAGATGVFAVQLAVFLGCHVIGTCSSDEKVRFLKDLGCHRAINYNTEDLQKVLQNEYPKGIDVVYESVGGSTFQTCVENLSIMGRLIIIGMISGYQDGSAWATTEKNSISSQLISATLLKKSASIRGFFLNHFPHLYQHHMQQLSEMMRNGKLKSLVDSKRFVGLDSIADAIDHMYASKNIGKIIVDISVPSQSQL